MSPLFITQMSTLLVHLSILVIVCSVSTSAWMTSIPRVYNNPWRRQRSHHNNYSRHSSISSTTQLSYRDDEHDDDDDSIKIKTQKTSSPSRPIDFQSRMKRAAIQNNRRSVGSNRRGKTASSKSWRPPNVRIAVSLEDFSNVIEEGRTNNQVVVVRFYANWCKVCVEIVHSAAWQYLSCMISVPLLTIKINPSPLLINNSLEMPLNTSIIRQSGGVKAPCHLCGCTSHQYKCTASSRTRSEKCSIYAYLLSRERTRS